MIKKVSMLFLFLMALTLTGCVEYPNITLDNVLTKCPEIISIIESMHKVSGSEPYVLKSDETLIYLPFSTQEIEHDMRLNVYVPSHITSNPDDDENGPYDFLSGIAVEKDQPLNRCGYWYGRTMFDLDHLGESNFYRWYVCYNFNFFKHYPRYLGKSLGSKTIDNYDVSLYLKAGRIMGITSYDVYGRFAIEGKSYLLCVTYLNEKAMEN